MESMQYHDLFLSTIKRLNGKDEPSLISLQHICVKILEEEDCLLSEVDRAKSISNKITNVLNEHLGKKLQRSKALELTAKCLGYKNWNDLCKSNKSSDSVISPKEWVKSCYTLISEFKTSSSGCKLEASKAKYNVVQSLTIAKKLLATEENIDDFFEYFFNTIILIKEYEKGLTTESKLLPNLISNIGKIEFNKFLYTYESPEIWKRIGLYYGSVYLSTEQDAYEHSLKRLFSVFFTNLVRLERRGEKKSLLADKSIGFLYELNKEFLYR